MHLFKKEYVIFNSNAKTKKQAFAEMANLAKTMGIVDDGEKLIAGFKKREREGSTGFEDGFAIPHAKIKEIKEPAVLFTTFKENIDWDSIDGQPTKVAIALLIPADENQDFHLQILSSIAKKLTDSENRKNLKDATNFEEINKILFLIEESTEKKSENLTNKTLIVGITACPVGVAHTYLAADKLTSTAEKMGYEVKIETHGSSGVENVITDEEVEKAEWVIIAADIGVDTQKFAGKKIYRANVSDAIKNPEKIINEAKTKAQIEVSKVKGEFNLNQKKTNGKTGIIKHLMSGVSYMVPMVIVGGIFLALSIGLTKAIYGNAWLPGTPGNAPINETAHTLAGNHFLSYLNGIGVLAFTLMVPILGAYIANSIAGRSAIVPAMLASYVANSPNLFFPIGGLTVQTPTGFIGAIGIGLGVGYLVNWINTWKIPKNLKPVMPLFFMPIVVGGLFSLLFVYGIGAPIGWVMNQLENGIKNILSNGDLGRGIAFGMGFLIGAMSGFDLGGPINKIAFFTCAALLTDPTNPISEPMGMMACAGAVPPLGMALCTFIFRKHYDEEEKQEGIAALIMGLIGISEGAIPFAIRNPKRVILSNVIGSGIAGALGGLMLVTDMAAHTGPIVVILGAVPYGIQTLYALIAIIAGTLITCLMNGLWMSFANKKVKKDQKQNKKLGMKRNEKAIMKNKI